MIKEKVPASLSLPLSLLLSVPFLEYTRINSYNPLMNEKLCETKGKPCRNKWTNRKEYYRVFFFFISIPFQQMKVSFPCGGKRRDVDSNLRWPFRRGKEDSFLPSIRAKLPTYSLLAPSLPPPPPRTKG